MICRICNCQFKAITNSHLLNYHGIMIKRKQILFILFLYPEKYMAKYTVKLIMIRIIGLIILEL
jgi:hypothetical protein